MFTLFVFVFFFPFAKNIWTLLLRTSSIPFKSEHERNVQTALVCIPSTWRVVHTYLVVWHSHNSLHPIEDRDHRLWWTGLVKKSSINQNHFFLLLLLFLLLLTSFRSSLPSLYHSILCFFLSIRSQLLTQYNACTALISKFYPLIVSVWSGQVWRQMYTSL